MPEIKAGRYQILEELGRGAMGVVYKAHDPTIGRTVAVKTLKLTEAATGLTHEELIKRFQTETRAAGLLTHPNIVVVYDAGEDSGLFYIIMELIQGRSLQSLIDQKQLFPLPRVTRIIEQAAAALDFAHQHNVVHRDIKPANLMIAGEDIVKVTDFGTAKILAAGSSQTGAILGTPSYMSPEQVKGKAVDGRSDIFSLGVILYELITGEKPFPGQNVTTVIYKIVNEEPIDPRELDSSIHPGLTYIINRALHKDIEHRYQTGKELVEDLKSYRDLGGASESATIVMPGRERPQAVLDAMAQGRAAAPATRESGHLSPPPATATPVSSGTILTPPKPAPRPPTLPALSYAPAAEGKKNHAGVWITLVLLVALGVGGYFAWPTISSRFLGSTPSATTEPATPAETADTQPAETQPPAGDATPQLEAPAAAPAAEPEPPVAELTGAKVKSDVEQRLERAGLGRKVRVSVAGNNVTLTGTLTPLERRLMRQRIGKLPGKWKLDDRIQEPRPAAAAAGGAEGESEKPRTAPGMGEVEVISEAGAVATLLSPQKQSQQCNTPCRFEDLRPGRYELDVSKPGFRSEKRIVNVRAGNISTLEIVMQGLASELIITSRPVGADIYINGDRHPERTPTTIQLQPGSYTISARKQGYQSFSQTVQMRGEEVRRMEITLTQGGESTQAPAQPAPAQPPPPKAPMGTLDVRSVPPNADILVNGTNTGRKTPYKLQLPPGNYRITVFLLGYQPIHQEITVEEGKTVEVRAPLQPR
jgi:serine/threonine-protein kinase